MPNYTIGTLDHDGMIYVIEHGTNDQEPEEYRTYWPTGIRLASHLREWVGAGLREQSCGFIFTIDTYPDGSPLRTSGRIEVTLLNRAKTLVAKVERTPIDPPKVRKGIEVRWYRGAWQKHLKREGWVSV